MPSPGAIAVAPHESPDRGDFATLVHAERGPGRAAVLHFVGPPAAGGVRHPGHRVGDGGRAGASPSPVGGPRPESEPWPLSSRSTEADTVAAGSSGGTTRQRAPINGALEGPTSSSAHSNFTMSCAAPHECWVDDRLSQSSSACRGGRGRHPHERRRRGHLLTVRSRRPSSSPRVPRLRRSFET